MTIELYRLSMNEAEYLAKCIGDDAIVLPEKMCVRIRNVFKISHIDAFIKIHTNHSIFSIDEDKNLCIVYRSDF